MRLPAFMRRQPPVALAEDLLAGPRDALAALGARMGRSRLSAMPAGPAECARFALPAAGEEAALACVILVLRVTRDGVTVRLADDDGAIQDHLYCVARDQAYTLGLFAEPYRATTLRVGHITPASDAKVLDAACLTLRGDSLAPERLIPQRRLDETDAWPADPYAEPGGEDPLARLRDRVFKGLTRPARATWLHDLGVLLEPNDEQSHCLMNWGLYEPESMCAMERRLGPGDVVVDVGANCGLYTLVAARAVGPAGRVVALEPSPREFARLERNVALNGFAHVRCLAAAAAERAERVALHVARPPFAGHNTIACRFGFDAVTLAETISVPAVPLDEVLRDEARCDLLKLDIEGAELLALRGAEAALSRLRPAVLMEVNPAALAAAGGSADELVAWMTDRGYRLHDIDRRTGALRHFAGPAGDATANVMALAG